MVNYIPYPFSTKMKFFKLKVCAGKCELIPNTEHLYAMKSVNSKHELFANAIIPSKA